MSRETSNSDTTICNDENSSLLDQLSSVAVASLHSETFISPPSIITDDNSSETTNFISSNSDLKYASSNLPILNHSSSSNNDNSFPKPSNSNKSNSCTNTLDWTRHISVEERTFIRDKIRSAYSRKHETYEELLDSCSAIDEELLFSNAPSRLDYFKSGVQFEKRVIEKKNQLTHGILSNPLISTDTNTIENNNQETKQIKRAKTGH
jgi:hypothetical protein